ncbi:MAG: hypothetical protein JWO86_1434 [Myxococcaceae bacterium]|nr:hypothetical protein [Myxococcaceae bacterium]
MAPGEPEHEPIVWWHPLVCLAAVTGLNALVAHAESRGHSPAKLFLALMMGPFSAWLSMPIHAEMQVPVPIVAACYAAVLPLVIYAARGTLAGLIFGSLAWWLVGYVFCVAVGI